SRLLSKTAKRITVIIVNLFAGTVCFFLMRAAMTFIQSEKQAGSTLFAGIPTWLFQIIIVIGFGLMMLRFFIHVLENLLAPSSAARKEAA
ncbi:MAG: TRAP transporter small permease, partial [candidate division KSB1 bacterium]|nr:TRAP transporter small permease [candidate division KSB1 bacterium]